MNWPKLSTEEIKQRIFDALAKNRNYRSERILGIPATYLDTDIFYEDAPFLKNAPFLSMLVANPNHIGCHTLAGEKEPIFKGTQQIERELIHLCAEQIFEATPDSCDGYVASGGTEANIEACWIYRNYFMKEEAAKPSEIGLIYSEDSHYSFPKASDLLGIKSLVIPVDKDTRAVDLSVLNEKVSQQQKEGFRYFIVIINLATTMFGSVDDVDAITQTLDGLSVSYKVHVDGAFGGFIYPFTQANNRHSFKNPRVSSITIDAHKMLQAPYGTGIFLIRKNMMAYVCTEEASYVQGKDYTLCGSRSGANAVCVWMILHMHGAMGWKVKMNHLLDKTNSLCASLKNLGVEFFRHPALNIVTIKSAYVSPELASTFCLIPDNHEAPQWYKIVLMPHVKSGVLDEFLDQLQKELTLNKVSL